MNDFERTIRSALEGAGESYEPRDVHEARRTFIERRRKRRFAYAGAGVATAAAMVLLAVGVLPRQSTELEPVDIAAPTLEVVATVPVGGEPVAVASSDDRIWVTNTDGNGVAAIDPATNEVVASIPLDGARPDEVIVGDEVVWVSDASGNVVRFDPADPTLTLRPVITSPEDDDVHLDLATDGTNLIAVDGAGTAYVSGPGRFEFPSGVEGFNATDVAAGDAGVWVLDGRAGRISEVVQGSKPVFSNALDVAPGAPNADLAVGFGYVWVSLGDPSTLYRVDPDNGEVVPVASTELYADITVGEDSVWALVTTDAGAELVQISPEGEVVGQPLSLGENANDVVDGAGSVWLPQAEDGEVLRVDAVDPPAPQPVDSLSPTPDDAPANPDEIALVYSSDGDIYADTFGGTVQLTDTPEEEIHPAVSPDGRYVVFERENDGEQELVTMDVEARDECCFRPGTYPAIGPNDQLAWVMPRREGEQARIGFSSLNTARELAFAAADLDLGVTVNVRNLTFDQNAQMLFYDAGYEGWTAYTADLVLDAAQNVEEMADPQPLTPARYDRGERYIAPSAAYALNVIKGCCDESESPDLSQLEFGEIDPVAEQGFPYRRLFRLDLGVNVDAVPEVYSVFLGHVTAEEGPDGSVVWTETDSESWLIGAGSEAWVVDATGRSFQLPYEVNGGAAAPHELYR